MELLVGEKMCPNPFPEVEHMTFIVWKYQCNQCLGDTAGHGLGVYEISAEYVHKRCQGLTSLKAFLG